MKKDDISTMSDKRLVSAFLRESDEIERFCLRKIPGLDLKEGEERICREPEFDFEFLYSKFQ